MGILIVEDDRRMLEGLTFAFKKEGYAVREVESIKEARKILFRKTDIDVMILDCNLPDGDGFAFCRELKNDYDIPILLLTARDMEEEMIRGFKAGADDYVTKPFSLAVLKLRIKALVKRKMAQNILCSGAIRLNFSEGKVFCGEKECRLSKTEYELLYYFLQNKNQLLSKEQLWESVWGRKERYVEDNSISMAVSRLRQKLRSDGAALETVHGMGYIWRDI